jgi:fatty acid desaturase
LSTSTLASPTVANEPDERRRGTDYADLSRRVKAAGLLDRRPGYYITRIAIVGTCFALGWAAVVLLGESWYQLIVAVFLAAVFTQIGFLGHDAGHGQIFRSARASRVLGLIHGNLAIGLSYGWWVSKHTRHHAHPNDVEKDPDVGTGALVFNKEAAAKRRKGFASWWTRNQAYLFFPLLLLEGLNLHVASIRELVTPGRRNRWLELGLLVLHLAAYITVVLVFMSPWQAVAFIAIQQGLFGLYMGCSFAPNHKGMPSLGPEENADFLRRQVLTSRNIRGGAVVDTVFGGLNYQIEHHLFPSMPRPALRRAQVLVREFCAERDVSYHETGVVRSFAEALGHLREVGAPLRAAPAA